MNNVAGLLDGRPRPRRTPRYTNPTHLQAGAQGLRHHRGRERTALLHGLGRIQRSREVPLYVRHEPARGLAPRPHAIRWRMASSAHAVEGVVRVRRARALAQGAIPPSADGSTPDAKGYAHAANTIEELAEKHGGAGRRAHDARWSQWNECCAHGRGRVFPPSRPARSCRCRRTALLCAAVCAVVPEHRRRPGALRRAAPFSTTRVILFPGCILQASSAPSGATITRAAAMWPSASYLDASPRKSAVANQA